MAELRELLKIDGVLELFGAFVQKIILSQSDVLSWRAPGMIAHDAEGRGLVC
jgi:hypothetical protein